jgi:hypothetical protein
VHHKALVEVNAKMEFVIYLNVGMTAREREVFCSRRHAHLWCRLLVGPTEEVCC